MELIDVLDKRGEKTGQAEEKNKIHEKGDWHLTVHVFILNSKKELLMQYRGPLMDAYPNYWDISCAGHVRAGESSVDGVIRELKEELGLEIRPEEIEYLFTTTQTMILDDGKYLNNEHNDIYLLRRDLDISQIRLQKEELADVKFINYQDLEKMINSGGEEFVPHPEEYEKLFEFLRNN